MGVPKFYRWISERYPCLSQVVREHQVPEFDNLYLDMNGIIHVCAHPNDDDPHFRISEEKIFTDIFHYLEVLFSIVKPKKVFFMAVDGVAPRAKMNQQRGRRFRTAKDAEDLIRKAQERGEALPKDARFDSNCITPGTPFMDRLHTQLQYFVNKKVTTDRRWRDVRVILSGHDVPGEGEHKVMDFVRWQRAQDGYDPNTRHCLYGLDADLMMLGLTSHEPHFSLLREEVRFGGRKSKKRVTTPEETTFHLLHLSLMREYIDLEFSSLRELLPFPYDLEKIIDDWVLMGFLVGNDFIPHLPNFHINHDALPYLYRTYMSVLPTLDGYLNEDGNLNMPRFEKYLRALSKFDYERFDETYTDLRWLEGKQTSKKTGKGRKQSRKLQQPVEEDLEEEDNHDDYEYEEEVPDGPAPALKIPEVFADRDELFHADFVQHKKTYYQKKLGFVDVDASVLKEQAKGYVVAVQWILHYYYQGVPSWSWFFPFHYAPFLSDIKDFSEVQVEFELGTPFRPFEQLLAVLPPASKELLPEAYQGLMLNQESPIIDFYPTHFETDLNGKLQEWEAVVLIPFIDETRLLAAMAPFECLLLTEEKERNKPGECRSYRFNPVSNFEYKSTHRAFPDITTCRAECERLDRDCFAMDPAKLRRGLCEGVQQDVYFPGFPTLKHLQYTTRIEKGKVRVFQMTSRNDSIILTLLTSDIQDDDVAMIARDWLNKPCHVSWPHLAEALVCAVTTESDVYTVGTGGKGIQHHFQSEKGAADWKRQAGAATHHYSERKGVNIGPVRVLIQACHLQGKRFSVDGRSGQVSVVKDWESESYGYALQTCLKDIHSPMEEEMVPNIEQLFPIDSECILLANPHYGSMVKVMSIDKQRTRVQVKANVLPEPDFQQIMTHRDALSDEYRSSGHVAGNLGVSPLVLSRITGSLQIERKMKTKAGATQNVNVGLNFKFSKKNEEMVGYARFSHNHWTYSRQAEEILAQYIGKFPALFVYLEKNPRADQYKEEDLLKDRITLSEISEWLRSLPCHKAELVPCGSETVDENVILAIEASVGIMQKAAATDRSVTTERKRYVTMRVRPSVLYRPSQYSLKLLPDPYVQFHLYDRVICAKDCGAVPLGLRGTLIGVHGGATECPLYEVVFDEPFLGGMTLRCSPNRGYKMPPSALINISHGKRLQELANRRSGLGASSSYQQSSYTERQPSNLSKFKPRGTVQVFQPSGSQPSAGKPRNTMENSEPSGAGRLPPRLANRGKVTLMTRGSEKSVTSNELNQEFSGSFEVRENETQMELERKGTAEGYLVDINGELTQQGVLVDFGGEEQRDSDWVNADLAMFVTPDGESVPRSDTMMAAIRGLTELDINALVFEPSKVGGENEGELPEILEESTVEEESVSEKETLPGNLAEDPTEVLKRILNMNSSVSPTPALTFPAVEQPRPVQTIQETPVMRNSGLLDSPSMSWFVALSQWCHLCHLPPPVFHYIPQQAGLWICVVELANGHRFKSYPVKGGHYEAAESAAMVALNQLPPPPASMPPTFPHQPVYPNHQSQQPPPFIPPAASQLQPRYQPPFSQSRPLLVQSQPSLVRYHHFQPPSQPIHHAMHPILSAQSPTFVPLQSPPVGAVRRSPMQQSMPPPVPYQGLLPPPQLPPHHVRPFQFPPQSMPLLQRPLLPPAVQPVPVAHSVPTGGGSVVARPEAMGMRVPVRGGLGFIPLQVARNHPEITRTTSRDTANPVKQASHAE